MTKPTALSTPMRRTALVGALVAVAVLVTAAPADAHAVLESSTPADGAELRATPARITLTFNEPVATTGGGVRLFDATGATVALGPPDATPPSQVQVPIERRLPTGSYIATWRVVSADGHPVRGALVFSVGDPAGVDDDVMRQVFGAEDRWWVAGASVLVRWLLYVGVLVAAGGAIFLRWAVTARDRPWLRAPVRRAAIVGAVAAVGTVPVQALQLSGQGPAAVVDGALLLATARSGVGLQSALVLFGLAVLVVALHHDDDPWAATIGVSGGAIAVVALLAAGHTRSTTPAWLILVADAVHLAAAATWLGGLLLLWRSVRLRRDVDDPVGAAGVVSRFSGLATIAVLTVTAAGVALSWALVRTTDALVTTPYGRLLLVKLGVVAMVVALGAYNNRRLVPAVRAAIDDPPRTDDVGGQSAGGTVVAVATPPVAPRARAWVLLGRTVRWEAGLLAVVLAVTAVLVGTQPAAEAAGVTGAFSAVVPMADHELNLVVDPNQVGVNEVHLYLLDGTGRPVAAERLQLRLSLPSEDIGPIVRTATPISSGHWVHVGRELALPGRWRIEAQATISQFERPRATIDVDVRPRS